MTREITEYEIDKKYQVQQNIADQKLQMSSTVKVGNENLMTISLLADKFSKAGNLIPKEFQGSPEKCFVAIYKGASLGIDAFTSLQRIAVINGRATIWGDTALSLVRKSGLLTKFKEEIIDQNGKLTAKCTVKRGDEDECISEFSQDDAVKAGLWGNNVWKTHPKRMLKYKARAFALRDIFSDVLDGLYLKEEMEGEQMLDVTPLKENQQQKSKTINQILLEEQDNKENTQPVKKKAAENQAPKPVKTVKEESYNKDTGEVTPNLADRKEKTPPNYTQVNKKEEEEVRKLLFNNVKSTLKDQNISKKDRMTHYNEKLPQMELFLSKDCQYELYKMYCLVTDEED